MNGRFRHAGPEEPAPYLIRGHPETLEKTGFGLSCLPQAGAGMTPLYENRNLWTDSD